MRTPRGTAGAVPAHSHFLPGSMERVFLSQTLITELPVFKAQRQGPAALLGERFNHAHHVIHATRNIHHLTGHSHLHQSTRADYFSSWYLAPSISYFSFPLLLNIPVAFTGTCTNRLVSLRTQRKQDPAPDVPVHQTAKYSPSPLSGGHKAQEGQREPSQQQPVRRPKPQPICSAAAQPTRAKCRQEDEGLPKHHKD